MARPLRIQFPGAFYHVMSRSNEDRTIFVTREDRFKFLQLLDAAHKRFGIIVHAYCLMSNHYHLLIETPQANISKAMQLINSGYNTHYLFTHEWVGHLFQGRFKAVLVDTETYLGEVSRYIHLNPVRAGMVKRPEEYEWSSYHYFVSDKPKPEYMNIALTLGIDEGMNLFDAMRLYREYVLEGTLRDVADPMKQVKSQTLLGSDDFVDRMLALYDKAKLEKRRVVEEPVKEQLSAEAIMQVIDAQDIGNAKLRTKIQMYFFRRYSDLTLEEVGLRCGKSVTNTAVSKTISRLEAKRKTDPELDTLLNAIDNGVKHRQKGQK